MVRNSAALKQDYSNNQDNIANNDDLDHEVSMQEILNSIKGVVSGSEKKQNNFEEFTFEDEDEFDLEDESDNSDNSDDNILELTEFYDEDDYNISNESIEKIDIEINSKSQSVAQKSKNITLRKRVVSRLDKLISRANNHEIDSKTSLKNNKNIDLLNNVHSENVTSENLNNNSGLTLDQLAKEAMVPLIAKWIDENLPSMVEEIVKQEVRKLTQDDDKENF